METKKKSKKSVIIAVVVVLLVAFGAYFAYAFFDVFKSNKTIYLEAEAKEMNNLSKKVEEYNKQYNEYIAPYLEGAVEQKMEISNLNIDMEVPDPQVQKVMDLLKDSKLIMESKMDDTNKKNYVKVNFNVKNSNLIGAEFFYDAEKLAFGAPALYNKYGYFNWKDKAVIKQKYDMDIPDKIPSQKEYVELIQIPSKELKPIIREYAKLYADSIKDEQVSVKKGATFEENGVKLAAREITVTFTPEQYKQLMKNIVEKISKDEKLQDLLYPRYQKLVELTGSGRSEEDLPKLSKEEFKKKFAEFKEETDRSLNKADFGDGVKMIVYVDRNDNILSRTIEFNNKNAGQKDVLKLASFQDNEKQDRVVFNVSSTKSGDRESIFTITYVNKKDGDNSKGNVKLNVTEKMGNTPMSDFKADADFTLAKDGNKENQDVNIKLYVNGNNTDPIALAWKGATTENDKDKTRAADYKVEINLPKNDPTMPPTMPKKIGFTIKNDEKFDVGEVKLPALGVQNSINLATLTDQQMMQIQQEIQSSVGQYVMKNMQLFQQLGIMPPGAGNMVQ
ncbi:DUF6583 family protein [Aneurinibacillus thermoaerophilus]|uniref:Uncharacterized protein n=1 Tax=Aneurinibacillus thermoaerophilus TaxID=143495 RepID=A0ABX8YAK4_ANETH|nr:DUF6583 family protein [Aneurinibacillus thermoaerophilus]MED0675385.1 hypothetical protein [Aneurinibacillus thermoaerophilus]MED0681179.1 hypothetical protein [Aneurinibacillus thermoaerophilus]MED0735419.1 hypothetical protein [Aneurinibacillus thermoaerophilus]MED0765131.1 hypothetical protein [Aneurinibacillus thermoaerophilus]QYY42698.1 hypothetical protein K3F53_18030 [Aneurinibacillus thermoaerophilus]